MAKRAAVHLFAGILAVSSAQAHPTSDGDFGVLVMAHGGGDAWNREVEAMLAPVAEDYPLEIAFGMADAASIQNAAAALEAKGVRRIAVVRLFVSGKSWFERTEQILGIRPGAPPRAEAEHQEYGGHGGHSMALWKIDTEARFALTEEGLAEAPESGAVLAERALGLSDNPERETVLILAHGVEDAADNARWLELIDARAEAVRKAAPFRRIAVDSLREDWPDKRKEAEPRIRAFVEEASADGGRVIVIPFRVAGFGPYAEVLDGLDYTANEKGLLPSVEIERWVRRQIEDLSDGEFRAPQSAGEDDAP